MGRARKVLRAFAAATGREVTRCNTYSAAGRLSLETKFRAGRYDVSLGSAWSKLGAWFEGLETPLYFAINRRGVIFGLDGTLDQTVGRNGHTVFVRSADDTSAISDWLGDAANTSLVDKLDMASRESLDICENALIFAGNAKRDWPGTLEILVALADSLPRISRPAGVQFVDGVPFDSAKLPADLRHLAGQIERWAVGDDSARSDRLRQASAAQRSALLEVAVPLLPRINDYLESFGETPLPDEAVHLSRLAEAASELEGGTAQAT